MNYIGDRFDTYNYHNKRIIERYVSELFLIETNSVITDYSIIEKFNYVIISIIGYVNLSDIRDELVTRRDLILKNNTSLVYKKENDVKTFINDEMYNNVLFSNIEFKVLTDEIKELFVKSEANIIDIHSNFFYYFESHNMFIGNKLNISQINSDNIHTFDYIKSIKDLTYKGSTINYIKSGNQLAKSFITVNDTMYSELNIKTDDDFYDSSLLKKMSVCTINDYNPSLTKIKNDKLNGTVTFLTNSKMFDHLFKYLLTKVKTENFLYYLNIFIFKIILTYKNKIVNEYKLPSIEELHNIMLPVADMYISLVEFTIMFINSIDNNISDYHIIKEKLLMTEAIKLDHSSFLDKIVLQ